MQELGDFLFATASYIDVDILQIKEPKHELELFMRPKLFRMYILLFPEIYPEIYCILLGLLQ